MSAKVETKAEVSEDEQRRAKVREYHKQYRLNNLEKVREYQREYQKKRYVSKRDPNKVKVCDNPDYFKDYMKTYNENNKERIRTLMYRPVWCSCCGKYIKKCRWNEHCRTKKHQKNLANGINIPEPEGNTEC